MIYVSDQPVRVQRKHSVRDAFQDGFDVAAPLFQGNVSGAKLAAGSLNLAAAGFQFRSHAVKGVHQIPDFIGSPDFHPVVESSPGNLLGRFGKCDHRTGNQLGEK